MFKDTCHYKLVPECKVLPGETAATHCVHSDAVVYPAANLILEVGGVSVTVKAAVPKTLMVSVLLGTDVAELGRLLRVSHEKMEDGRYGALMVVTCDKQRKRSFDSRKKLPHM